VPGCTPLTPRCANAREYDHELRECCRGHVIRLMRVLVPMFAEQGVRWWADYGTLLGAVRNPLTTWGDYPWLRQDGRKTKGPAAGIIPHDKDADLGVLWSDWQKVRRIGIALQANGYNVAANYQRGMTKVRLSRKNHTNVDLFFWRQRPGGTLFRSGYAKVDDFKGREFPRTMLEPMTQVQWEGMTIPAPADPAAFLAMRYGPNWRKPVMANHDGVRR